VSSAPTAAPAPGATSAPTAAPAPGATSAPTAAPVVGATSAPTAAPVVGSTSAPTAAPATGATAAPAAGATAAPTSEIVGGATSAPVVPGTQVVRVLNYYLAYVSPSTTEPTEEEYQQMLDLTTEYFTMYFEEAYADDADVDFISVTVGLKFTEFDDPGFPPEIGVRYNIYMDYSFSDWVFTEASTPPTDTEIFSIMRNSIDNTYILEWVRSLTGTPFAGVTEVIFAASIFDAPP
jgi:hypothetical protein